jgi:hypothetical protein
MGGGLLMRARPYRVVSHHLKKSRFPWKYWLKDEADYRRVASRPSAFGANLGANSLGGAAAEPDRGERNVDLGWQIDLVGSSTDISDVTEFVGAGVLDDLAIIDGPQGKRCLAGSRFNACINAEEARTEAAKALPLLNGLARFNYMNHRQVEVGSVVWFLHEDGRFDTAVFVEGLEMRLRLGIPTVSVDGSTEADTSVGGRLTCAHKIANNRRLAEIAEILSGELSWQRLRIAFEKVTLLIGRSGKDAQALWQKGYATREEVVSFKANIQDPRHSGIDAVHGVADGEIKGIKMSIDGGFSFVVRLINTYIERQQ